MSNQSHELILVPRIENPKVVGSGLQTDLADLTKAVNANGGLRLDITLDNKAKEKIKKQVIDINDAIKSTKSSSSPISEESLARVNQQVEILRSRIDKAKVSWSQMLSNPEIVAKIKEIQSELDKVNGDKSKLQSLQREWQILSNRIGEAGLSAKNFGDRVTETFSRLSAYLVNVLIIGTITRSFKSALSDLKEIDDQLTQISKVTDLVRANFKQASIEAIESANRWGRTATDYLEAVKTFAQAGATNYKELADLSVLAQSAGDMTADLASDYLVATNAAFGLQYSVSELTKVLDGQNNISNKSAVTMTEMAMATKNYANTAVIAGESAASMSAMITAGVASTTKPGEEIGRALRTLSMNIRQIKGETEDGIIDEASMAKAEKALNSINIQTRHVEDGLTRLKTPSEVLGELAAQYESGAISAEKMAIILENVGSKRQADILAAMVTNWHLFEKAMIDFGEGTGTAATEAQKDLESWNGKLNILSNTWTAFVAKTLDTEWIKIGLDGLTGLIKIFDNLGNALLFAAGAFLVLKRAAIANLFITMASLLDTLVLKGMYAWDAMKNLGLSIMAMITNNKAFVASQTAANTAMGAGALSASALSAAIGLVVVALSVALMAYGAWAREQEASRRAAIDAAEGTMSEVNALRELLHQYESLSNILSRTKDEEDQYRDAQSKIITLLGQRQNAVEGLTASTKEYSEALKEAARDEMIEQLNIIRRGRVAAEEELESMANGSLFGIGKKGITHAVWDMSDKNPMYNQVGSIFKDYQTSGMGDAPMLVMPKDAKSQLEFYADAAEAIGLLDAEYNKLWASGDRASAEAITQSSLYRDLSGAMLGMSESVSKVLETRYAEAQLQYEIANGIPRTTQEYTMMREEVFDLLGVNEMYRDQIYGMVDEMYPALSHATSIATGETASALDVFEETLSSTKEKVDILKAALDEQTTTGKISAETYVEIARAGKEYADLVQITSDGTIILAEETENYINKMVEEAVHYGLLNGYTKEQIGLLAELFVARSSLNDQLDAMQSAYSTVATAIDEYNESKSVSIDTFQALLQISPEYLSALDLENGQLTINEAKILDLTEALKQEAILKLQSAAAADIKAYADGEVEKMSNLAKTAVAQLGDNAEVAASQLTAGGQGAVNFAAGVMSLAAATGATVPEVGDVTDAANAIISAYEGVAKKISSMSIDFGSVAKSKKSSSSSKKEADAHLEAYKNAVKEIQYLRDMDIIDEAEYYRQLEALANQYLKGKSKYTDEYRKVEVELHNYRKKLLEEQRKAEIKAAEDSYNAQKKAAEESFKAQKKAAEDAYKAQRKALEDQRDLLNDQLDAYKKLIDYRKELLKRDSDSRTYEQEVAESNKRIANIQSDIDALALDNSAKADAKRVDLIQQLNEEKAKLEEIQYDRSYDLQNQALDDEYDRYKEHIDAQLKLLNDQMDAMRDAHERMIDNMQASHEAMLASLEASSQAFIQSIESKFDHMVSEAVSAANQIAAAFEYAYAKGQGSTSIMQTQQQLVAGGYNVGSTGVDGIWGKNTEAAFTRAWQEYLNSLGANLTVDGIRGSKTKAAEKQFGVTFPTYHTGGVVGEDIGTSDKKEIVELFNLTPDEVVAKLLKGETVMTGDQMSNLSGTFNQVQRLLLDTSKLAAVMGGGRNTNHLSAMTDAAKDSARAVDVKTTNNITIEQQNVFHGVDLSNTDKLESFADKIAKRAEKSVFDTMVKFNQLGNGFRPRSAF